MLLLFLVFAFTLPSQLPRPLCLAVHLSHSSRSCPSEGLCSGFACTQNLPVPRLLHGCLFLSIKSLLKCHCLQETFPDRSKPSISVFISFMEMLIYLKFLCLSPFIKCNFPEGMDTLVSQCLKTHKWVLSK